MTLAENLEVLNLRAIAGEYDIQERHTDIAKLPVFLENQEKGGYIVRLDPAPTAPTPRCRSTRATTPTRRSPSGSQTADFRHALSMGIDRDQLNETFWLGVGDARQRRPLPGRAVQPGPGVADQVGHARRRAGQSAARRDRPDPEGRRGLPAAH